MVEFNCPGCNARILESHSICEWCKQPIVIKNFKTISKKNKLEINKYTNTYKNMLILNNVNKFDINKALGICFLKLKLFDKSLTFFEKSLEFNIDDSEVYYYIALSFLNGKKPYLNSRKIIDKILENIEAAIMIDAKNKYYYLMAYIKYDYFFRKSYKTNPTYKDILFNINGKIDDEEIEEIFEIIGIDRIDLEF